jgi:LysR family glycine cleavage system transcriptional activator
MQGSRYEHFSILISAAYAGLGIARIPHFLIMNELQRKELTVAFDLPLESEDAYYLVAPEENVSNNGLNRFKEWILDEVRNTQVKHCRP